MFLRWRVLLCTLALISHIDKSFSGTNHTYPKSGGLSGSDNLSYLSSDELSGDNRGYSSTDGNRGYPSPTGRYPTSGGSYGYPSSGGSHGYNSSGGSYKYPTSGGSNRYPSVGSRHDSSEGSLGNPSPGGNYNSSGGIYGYPSSGGKNGYLKSGSRNEYLSSGGSHGNPAARVTSGKSHNGTSKRNVGITQTTNTYNHYDYNPPYMIKYVSAGSKTTVLYRVNKSPPPKYVYYILDSGSKYRTLLAGLALMNLGTLGNNTYSYTHNGFNYKTQPGEVCLFGIQKSNGDFEETKIDCQLITSFILFQEILAESKARTFSVTTKTPTVNSTRTRVFGNPIYAMLRNSTFVPLNTSSANSAANTTITSSVTITTTTTNTTVINALDVKGIISVCWVAGAGVGLLPLFGWHADVDVATTTGCYFVDVMSYNYLLFLYFATIVTPSVLLAAFYAHIYRVVVKQLSDVMTVGGGRGRISGGGTMLRVLGAAQKREVKATQNLAIIVFFFILCWMPLYTVNAAKAFMPSLDIPNPLTYFCIIFSHLNSAINPLLYAYHLKDFRAAMKGLLCSMIGRGVPIPTAYMPPIPIRRPALERCNALRERPRIYVHSPVWLHQRVNESNIVEENGTVEATTAIVPDVEPFLNKIDSSSGCYTPDSRDIEAEPYLIESNQERCQSPYRKVEELIRRVRSVSGEHS